MNPEGLGIDNLMVSLGEKIGMRGEKDGRRLQRRRGRGGI